MSLVSNNIRTLRKLMGFTQEQFAERIGIKRSLLGAYEEGRADPRLNNLKKMAQEFGISLDVLLTNDLTQRGRDDLRRMLHGQDSTSKSAQMKVLSITVDKEEKENIELVPQKASAGYLNGYADPEYLTELPRFQLPMLPQHGTYRAFETSGDSMLPLPSGTIIIGQYVEGVKDIRSGRTYVLVSAREGVVYKRLYNQLAQNGTIKLVSDNTLYEPYEIPADDVLEIWEAKAYIGLQFPDPNQQSPATPSAGKEDMSMEKLTSIVLDLQQEVIRLREK